MRGTLVEQFAGGRLRGLTMALSVTLCAALSGALPGAAQAQDAPALPDYVIAQFGLPPEIPEGPLSDELLEALQVVFVDSLEQSLWGPQQEAALALIAGSQDPRLAWIISDMMRFTWRPRPAHCRRTAAM